MSLADLERCLCGHSKHRHATQPDPTSIAGFFFHGQCGDCGCRGFLRERRHRWLDPEALARVGIVLD